jgi:hypothetical protein
LWSENLKEEANIGYLKIRWEKNAKNGDKAVVLNECFGFI